MRLGLVVLHAGVVQVYHEAWLFVGLVGFVGFVDL